MSGSSPSIFPRLAVAIGALVCLIGADLSASAANPFALNFRRPESQPPQPEIVTPPPVVTPPPPPVYYGAIAVSAKTSAWGSAWNYTSLAEAEASARSRCKQRDCKIAVSGSNACMALSIGRGGGWGSGRGATQTEADNYSLSWCRKYTSKCKLTKARFCTGT